MRFHELAWTALVAGLAFSIGALPAAANGSSKPKVKTGSAMTNAAKTAHGSTAHAPKTNAGSAHAPKTAAANAPKTNAGSANAHGAKAKTHPKHTKAHGKSHDGTTNAGGDNGATNAGGNRGTNAAGDNAATPPNKAQQHLAQNEHLRAKLQSRLPPGTDVNAAAAGFRNLGQFVAAVNVSHNLGISFVDLKALMTGDHPKSLGQSIQQLKGMDANASGQAANAALSQANGEIRATTNAAPNPTNAAPNASSSTPTGTATGPGRNN